MSLTIEPELKQLIPPLSQDELQVLRGSLQGHGQLDPVRFWKKSEFEHVILDGHNRFQILTDLGVKIRSEEVKTVSSLLEAKLWMLSVQLGRRNVSDSVRKMLAALRYEVLCAISRGPKTSGPNSPGASEQIKLDTGFTKEKLRTATELIKAHPESISDVIQGRKSLNQARKEHGLIQKGAPGGNQRKPVQQTTEPESDSPEVLELQRKLTAAEEEVKRLSREQTKWHTSIQELEQDLDAVVMDYPPDQWDYVKKTFSDRVVLRFRRLHRL